MAQPSSNSDARQTWFAAASSRAWASVSASMIIETSRSVKESSHKPMTSPSGTHTPSQGLQVKRQNSGTDIDSGKRRVDYSADSVRSSLEQDARPLKPPVAIAAQADRRPHLAEITGKVAVAALGPTHTFSKHELLRELPCRCHVQNGEEMAGDMSRSRIGSYGAGALWCVRRQGTLLMLFNDTPIARRARNATPSETWMVLDNSWRVRSLDGAEVLVQHNGSEGVIVSLHGGNQ
jgi:hypothetical protein